MQFRVVRENENAAGEEAQCRVSCGMGVLPTVRSQLAVRKQLRPRGEALADTRLGQVVGGVALPIRTSKVVQHGAIRAQPPSGLETAFFFLFWKKERCWHLAVERKEGKENYNSFVQSARIARGTDGTDRLL